MSYLVLARKYRPTTFADIVGQEHVVRTLGNAIKLSRVHHAFLFTGARGVGKTTTARVLARALNCELGPTAEPCGRCVACVEIGTGASPDVLEIDGASNTGVDNVRELRENVRYLPSRGRFKLYIIDEVHMLSTAAFNALLKTLEEPPAHVKFIFATTEPQKIPVTILSRCQRFDFRRVSVVQLVEHVKRILAKEGVTLGPAALTTIVREAQGSVRDALSLLDQVLSFAGEAPDDAQVAQALGIVERETVFQLADAVLTRDARRLLTLVAEVDARGHDLGDLAGLLVEHVRDVMVVGVTEAPSETVLERSPGEIAALREQAHKQSRPDLHRLFAGLVAVAEDVGRSPHPRVSLEMGLLRLLELEPVSSLGELLGRLDRIIAGKGGVPGPGGGELPAPGANRQRAPKAPADAAGAGEKAPSAASAGGDDDRGSSAARAVGEGVSRTAAARGTARRVGASATAAGSATGGRRESAAATTAQTTPPGDPPPAGAPSGEGGVIAPEPDPTAGSAPSLAWSRLVDRVRQAKPAVASVLEHAHLLRFGPDGVDLAFPAGTFYWEAARDPEARALVTRVLEEQFGQPVALTLATLDAASQGATASLAAAQDESRRQRERSIKERALEHPAVRDAISVLGGQVTNVKALADLDGPAGDGR